MTVLLNDHDLCIVIAPAIVMAARPSTMEAAIVIAVFRDNNCSILRVCGYDWRATATTLKAVRVIRNVRTCSSSSAITHR
ncbi:MAG: hypothetical protein WCB77_09240 [Pseudolabrys sp.]